MKLSCPQKIREIYLISSKMQKTVFSFYIMETRVSYILEITVQITTSTKHFYFLGKRVKNEMYTVE